MGPVAKYLSVLFLLSSSSGVLAQAAGGGADFNRRDREQVKEMEAKRARVLACQRGCDSVGRTNSIACGQFALQLMATCNLNVQKQTAACYQTCR